jgi:chaperonin GroEL
VRRDTPRLGLPHLVYGPAALAALLRGMDRMTALVRPTLGPSARTVAIARAGANEAPEVLDSAATIVRRTIQLADPFEDMGAMIVRHLVWRTFETAGDGGATAAVLCQRLVREALTCLAAGYNPVPLRRGVERALAAAVEALGRQARPVELPAEIAGLVAGTVRDPALAEMIGEVMDAVGPDGAVVIEPGSSTRTVCDYVEGVEWNEGYVSHFLLPEDQTTVRLSEPFVLLTDQVVERAEQLVPALEACVKAGGRSLLVVAADVRDPAVGLLVLNRERGILDSAVAVKAPSLGVQRTRILEDLAALTGGRCVHQEWQERLEEAGLETLGRARQAWATRTAFGLVGGAGERAAIRQRLAEARGELTERGVIPYDRDRIRERIGKLAGTVAVIRVGAPTPGERDELKPRLEAAVRSARLALQHGAVPGGGAALLACRPAVAALQLSGDEAVGASLLARALAEPLRTIAHNAGLEAGPLLREACRRGPDAAFDALRREWVDAWSAGLLDPLTVVQTALETGVSAGTTAMSSEVLVRRDKPPVEINP